MQLRRYAVTVIDNWTPMRLFWTRDRAELFWLEHKGYAHLYRWSDGRWETVAQHS